MDYNENALGGPAYVLWVPRGEADPRELMLDYGLDMSEPASSSATACLYTRDPYAAASFHKCATDKAREQLGWIVTEVEKSWATDSDLVVDVPAGKELWPYQRASVEYALARDHAIIGEEMGLGKTPIAIAIANQLRAKRVLVVCPAVIRYQWLERIKEWSTMNLSYEVPNDLVYTITSSRRGVHETAAWTVISWDLIRNPALHKALVKNADGTDPEYDLLVLDEAHMAKSVGAKRTQAIFGGARNPVADPIASRCKKIIALTGTPLPNRPSEAYTLCRHLNWEAIDWMNEEDFMERYNPTRRGRSTTGKVYTDEATGRLPELQNRLRSHLMVRHLKADVMPQLQLPEYDIIRVQETEAVKAALKAESVLQLDPDQLLEGADIKILGAVSTARLEMGIAMAPQVVDWVKMLMEGGSGKLVLFAWHKQVLDILEAGLSPYGIVRVDGSTTAKQKQAKIHRFINEPDARIIVGNVLSLGTGTDGLQQVSTHCLIAEASWVMAENQQCIDRLNRVGQTGKVQADFFVAPGSLSEKVLASALRKAHTVHRALDRQPDRKVA
jgi:SWI/SNF-related matrix-associated actin-dependent regulator 1 of chromatin subfamily A